MIRFMSSRSVSDIGIVDKNVFPVGGSVGRVVGGGTGSCRKNGGHGLHRSSGSTRIFFYGGNILVETMIDGRLSIFHEKGCVIAFSFSSEGEVKR